jgi:hypothetical protein
MISIEEKYRRWRTLPESEVVLAHFRRLATEAAERGWPFSAKALAERVRWEILMTQGTEGRSYTVNNSYVSLIAREIAGENPSLRKCLKFRKLASERQLFPEQWMTKVQGPRRIPTLQTRVAA